MSQHEKFILQPITDVLEEAVIASSGLSNGIENHPLYDYIIQSLFLKMTGFQEQKIKCISWELATNDYDYRRKLLNNDDKLGECSSYRDKTTIYKRLFEQIHKYDSTFKSKNIQKKNVRKNTSSKMKEIFTKTNIFTWGENLFKSYNEIWKKVNNNDFVTNETDLFPEKGKDFSLKRIYVSHLYEHRNRIAHNTNAFQQNLPTFKTLMDENYIYNNYFLWFSILVLMDNIFIELYRKYSDIILNN